MSELNLPLINKSRFGANLDWASTTSSNSYPSASSIESTMYWLDRIAEQHGWTSHFSSDPLITSNGFVWKRHNGESLEDFTPVNSGNYGLTGYPTHSKDFWHHIRRVIEFAGEKILQHYDLSSGSTNDLSVSSGNRWGLTRIASQNDLHWLGYGSYDGGSITTRNSGEQSYVPVNDMGNTLYMDRVGVLQKIDYSQYKPPLTKSNGITFHGAEISRVLASSISTSFSMHYVFPVDVVEGYGESAGASFGPINYYYYQEYPFYTDGSLFNSYNMIQGVYSFSGWVGPITYQSGKWDTTNSYYTDSDFQREQDLFISGLMSQPISINTASTLNITAQCQSNIESIFTETYQSIKYVSHDHSTDYWTSSVPTSLQPTVKSGLVHPGIASDPRYSSPSGYLFAPLMTEQHNINLDGEYRYRSFFVPVSRNVYSPLSVNSSSSSYYIKSFTGMTESDTLPVSMSGQNQTLPTGNVSGIYSIGLEGQFISSTAAKINHAFSSGLLLDNYISASPINGKIVYGFINYDPSVSGCINETNESRNYIFQKIDEEILNNRYAVLSSFTIPPVPSFTPNFITSSGPTGDIASIQGLVDMTPSGNIFYISYLPSNILNYIVIGNQSLSLSGIDFIPDYDGYLAILDRTLAKEADNFYNFSAGLVDYNLPLSGDWVKSSYGATPSNVGGKNFIDFGPLNVRSDTNMYKPALPVVVIP